MRKHDEQKIKIKYAYCNDCGCTWELNEKESKTKMLQLKCKNCGEFSLTEVQR